jgi:hypothetical protein
VACAVAGLALLLSWPAAAQPVTLCDSNFSSFWTLQVFSCPAGNSVTATLQAAGGSTSTALPYPQPPATPATCLPSSNPAYRSVTNTLLAGNNIGGTCPGESTVYGVHIFGQSYVPKSSGAVGSIDFQIDYECLSSAGATSCAGYGQGFGPALLQNGHYFVANAAHVDTGITTGWKRFSTSPPLAATDFSEITTTGSGSTQVITFGQHPDFSATAQPIQCGFYTADATFSAGYTIQAGYDNWACTITPVPQPGILKVCKVAGPGIAVGTAFGFSANGNPFQVPAGPAPGGTCVVVNPSFPVGTIVNVVETIPPNDAVSNITVAVAPPSNVVSTNLTTGTVVVKIGSGVTEVTYTDYKTTGYIEICKGGDVGGSFSFTVNPGNLGPFVVPAGACSPAIQVTAGSVTITEAPNSGTAMSNCTTIPSGRLVSCPPGTPTATVTVVPGDVPTETIATINNARIPPNNNPQ